MLSMPAITTLRPYTRSPTRLNANTLAGLPPDVVEIIMQNVLADDVQSAVRLSAACKLLHGVFRMLLGRAEYKFATSNIAVRVMLCAWQAGVSLAEFPVLVFGTVRHTAALPRYNELAIVETGAKTDTDTNTGIGVDVVAWMHTVRSVWPAVCRTQPVFVALARSSVFGGVAGLFLITSTDVPAEKRAVGDCVCVRGHIHAEPHDNYTLVEFVVDSIVTCA